MDILELVDRLEDLFNESHSVPFTHSVVVDEDRMLDIIDQMRASIPDQIKKAEQIVNQRDRFLAQAQEEASRITAIAREKRVKALTQEEVVQEAAQRAEELINEAKLERDRLQRETDKYIITSLQNLEQQLTQIMKQVENGITTVNHSGDITNQTED